MSTHQVNRSDWTQGKDAITGAPTMKYVGATEGWYKAPRWSDMESFDSSESDERESVYIVHSPKTGRVKIGRSKQVYKRFTALRSMSPDQLELLAVWPEASELEMHKRFAASRLHGEWFDDSILSELGLG